jgi:hypothetical protein
MTEPLHAYVVGMQWSDGGGSMVRIVGHRPEQACAMAAVVATRNDPKPEGDLIAVMVTELPLDWLRWAVRSIEEGKVEEAPVVKLVKPTELKFPNWNQAIPWGPNSPNEDPAA